MLQADSADCNQERANLRKLLTEKNDTLADLYRQLGILTKDTTTLGLQYRKIQDLNHELNTLYEKVIKENQDLLASSSKDKQDLAQQLDAKAKQLNQLQDQLDAKQKNLDILKDSLDEREKRVKDLQGLVAKQNSAINDLRNKVAAALIDFDKGDLNVEVKDGKVYVSMSEQLLFKSGSTAVDPKGADALKKIAEVLNKNSDFEVMVEGHTDNVPLHGFGDMKDNWDLSVLRATSIVKILTDNGLEPKRVVASGRGEYHPVADNSTPEGRARNRRTEIILSPNLDSLMNLLKGGNR